MPLVFNSPKKTKRQTVFIVIFVISKEYAFRIVSKVYSGSGINNIMASHLKDIIENIKQVSMSKSSLNILLDFERVLDEMNLYAFMHWKTGELVDGPEVGKYRVKCTFMWPYGMMPDPAGAERLLNFGASIQWSKDWLVYPIKIETADDYLAGTKKPKLAQKRIWLVTIDLPKSLIKDIHQGSEDVLNSTIDLADIDAAYEKNLEKQGINGDQTKDQMDTDMANSAGEEENL
jgi:hypothetical protein